MRTIHLDNTAYQLPERWADVPPERLAQLLQLVYFTPATGDSYLEIIRLALNAKPRVWKLLMRKHFGNQVGKKARTANAIVLRDLYRLLGWMESEPIHERPFGSISVNGVDYLLPETGFLTMSFGELTDAYIHFLAYIRQLVPGNERLNLLVATLCRPAAPGNRPADWNGDERELYNEYIARERAALVNELAEADKLAVLLFFAGNMKTLLGQYAIFGDGDGEPEEYPAQGLVKNAHLLAEKHIFGNMSGTKAANVHEVLLYLEEHRKDLLAEYERNKAANQ
ncbi:hypothetical protein CLV58_101190 [Spirosoma oryzae]|uniref:Uncharacterized protein n=1 Tax=Spirosoma oryzae TaxID=1469603 RepID=A0A2T0TN20_9BACT|nr:hypothetical protein [Spirosoma oryzae]PRY47124.1 hypothetical protein CLV58_101190 [Spirosoma oryzae]